MATPQRRGVCISFVRNNPRSDIISLYITYLQTGANNSILTTNIQIEADRKMKITKNLIMKK